MTTDRLPFLDLTAPGFSTRSADVLKARTSHWCARTPFGYAVLRHGPAGRVLRDRRFRQGSHAWPQMVGLTGAFAEFWKRSIISLEGALHRELRGLAQTALASEHITALAPVFRASAAELCAGLRDRLDFDLVEDFSEPFAGHVIAALLGEPIGEAAAIAFDASRLGLAMGPDARTYESEVDAAVDRLSARAEKLIDAPSPGSFVARLLDGGVTDRQALIDLIVIAIFGGVDTTRAQLAFAGELFAEHRAEWSWLRGHREALPAAIDEVIRMRPTTTWATREALEDVEIDGVTIHAGETVHVFVHATGTDPEAGHRGGFDIRARRKAHFGFGGGAHHCLGHLVARTDMAAALDVWLDNWSAIELAGVPTFLPDSGNTSPLALPVRAVWD